MVTRGGRDHRFLARLASAPAVTIAHRGDSFHAPENTLEAAIHAHADGADAWELDVHLTRDEVAVVVHDESLLRTTDVARKFPNDPRRHSGYLVSDFDFEELRTLDAGSWFLDNDRRPRSASHFRTLDHLDDSDRERYASGQVRIPALGEALDLTAELDWLVNVELKSVPTANPRLAEVSVALVRERAIADRVLISSFDHGDVARVARLAPEIATGVLTVTPLYRPAAYVCEWVGAQVYHPSAEAVGAGSAAYCQSPSPQTLRQEDLRDLAEIGVWVLVFTVNDHRPGGLAEHLLAAGVTGLFTDDPGGARR
jgi:glycerophosphoryl diester phosphodiesterase